MEREKKNTEYGSSFGPTMRSFDNRHISTLSPKSELYGFLLEYESLDDVCQPVRNWPFETYQNSGGRKVSPGSRVRGKKRGKERLRETKKECLDT